VLIKFNPTHTTKLTMKHNAVRVLCFIIRLVDLEFSFSFSVVANKQTSEHKSLKVNV
jgi:hypothetical protein